MRRRVSLGERSSLLAQVGEFSAMAAAMVGLRGNEAQKAKAAGKREFVRQRWEAICNVANARAERIKRRDVREFDERVHRILSHVTTDEKSAPAVE